MFVYDQGAIATHFQELTCSRTVITSVHYFRSIRDLTHPIKEILLIRRVASVFPKQRDMK